MTTIRFAVRGVPVSQGSVSAFRGRVVWQRPKNLSAWRRAIADAARAAIGDHAIDPARPIAVRVTFWLPRPRGHYGQGSRSAMVRPSAPAHPAGRPDLDKLVRALLDALHLDGAFYRDDAQVVQLVAEKRYADDEPPGAQVEVSFL